MPSLEELQIALAKSLTSTQDNRTSPERSSSCASNVCDPILSEFDSDELHRSRDTLFRKRISQTSYLLPNTTRILGDRYRSSFADFADRYRFVGFQAPQRDAIAFASHIAAIPSVTPGWIRELAIWESLPILWATFSYHCSIYRFKFSVWKSPKSLTPKSTPANRTSLWLVYRYHHRGGITRLWG